MERQELTLSAAPVNSIMPRATIWRTGSRRNSPLTTDSICPTSTTRPGKGPGIPNREITGVALARENLWNIPMALPAPSESVPNKS